MRGRPGICDDCDCTIPLGIVMCEDCKAHRKRLAALRRYLETDECEQDQLVKAKRVAEYERRVKSGLGVFEKPVA